MAIRWRPLTVVVEVLHRNARRCAVRDRLGTGYRFWRSTAADTGRQVATQITEVQRQAEGQRFDVSDPWHRIVAHQIGVTYVSLDSFQMVALEDQADEDATGAPGVLDSFLSIRVKVLSPAMHLTVDTAL